MSTIEILILSVALAMDAFAVAICKGLAMKGDLSQTVGKRRVPISRADLKNGSIVGIWFGGFQALMPIIGYFLGNSFYVYIERFDHWIAFLLLVFIGGNMLKEALSNEEETADNSLSIKTMFLMAIATSIDALAVGLTFAALQMSVGRALFASASIGVITFVISAVGVKIGSVFGAKYKSKAELAGGVVLIGIGLKILLEHLGVLSMIGLA